MSLKPLIDRVPTGLWAMIVLSILWAVGILIVDPEGDFPLNDDWAYARGVKSFVEEGKLVLDTWPAMTLISQIGLGIIYCELFGFSFEVLRWSTLINSLLCLWLYYWLLLRFTTPGIALFATTVLLFNPLYFSLSFTFMTEVHFLLLLMCLFLSFFRYVETSRDRYLIWATLFSILATLLRQPGLLAPLACGIALLLYTQDWRGRVVSLLPFLISFVTLKLYDLWIRKDYPELFRVGGAQDLIVNLTTRSWGETLPSVLNLGLTPGLFLLPLIILLLPGVTGVRKWVLWITAEVVLGGSILLWFYLGIFPQGNVFYNLGLGPKTLKGYYYGPEAPRLDEWWWNVVLNYVAVVGVGGIILLLWRALPKGVFSFSKTDNGRRAIKWWMLVFYCAFYTGVATLITYPFDRHTLPLIPFVAVLMVPQRRVRAIGYGIVAFVCLLVFTAFSIAATHDYLAWNRIRKEANEYLREVDNIPPTFIDAGFELNGWLQAGPERTWSNSRSWWFVTEDDYALTLKPVGGYKWYRTYYFPQLLPPKRGELYILKRQEVGVVDSTDFPIIADMEKVTFDSIYFLTSHPKIRYRTYDLLSTEHAHSGEQSYKLFPASRRAPTTKLYDPTPGDRLTYSVWRYPAGSDVKIAATLDYSEQLVQVSPPHVTATDEAGWERVETTFTIPPYRGKNRITLAVENYGIEEAWVDDIRITRHGINTLQSTIPSED